MMKGNDDAEKVLNEVIIEDNYDSRIMIIQEVEVKHHDDTEDILGREITAGGISGPNIKTISEVETKHCNDNAEDIHKEEIIAGETFKSNIISIIKVESEDSTAKSRCNRMNDSNIISRPNNHNGVGIVYNKEIATRVISENKVNYIEAKPEERSFVSLIAKHWKDENKSYLDNRWKDSGDVEITKAESSDTNCIDFTDHEKVNSSNAHSEENMVKNPTCSNHLTNGECKVSTLGSEIKLLRSPNDMKTVY